VAGSTWARKDGGELTEASGPLGAGGVIHEQMSDSSRTFTSRTRSPGEGGAQGVSPRLPGVAGGLSTVLEPELIAGLG
jgi:hypothetical protein